MEGKMRKLKSKGVAQTVTLTALLVALGSASFAVAATPAPASVTGNQINTDSRDAVAIAYVSKFRPADAIKTVWTGNSSTCNAGTQSAEAVKQTTNTINLYRGLAGLDSIATTAKLNDEALQGALLMEANQTLSHYPTANWKCYTSARAGVLGRSNLAMRSNGFTGANLVQQYMDDSGPGNHDVGHRRWLLNPEASTIGIGTANTFNAITVFGSTATDPTRAKPQFIAFPNAGYFPQQLEPDGRWSLSSSKNINFKKATVSVTSDRGNHLVTKYPSNDGYGPNTLSFQVNGVYAASGAAESNFMVSVTNMINDDGKVFSHHYTVRLFDGNIKTGAVVPTPTPTPTVTPTPTPTPTVTPTPTPTPTVTPTPTPNNSAIKSAADVLAIDTKGQLWNYGTLNAKSGSAKRLISAGWGGFSDVFVTDWNSDGVQDILGQTKLGQLYAYKGNKSGGFNKQLIGSSSWQHYTIITGKWKASEKNPSIVARNNSTGKLYHYSNPNGGSPEAPKLIGSGWNGLLLTMLDWDKDGKMDIITKNTAGKMTIYRTNGSGTFTPEARKTIGSGWNSMNSIKTMTGHDGKGTVGILARDTAGKLYYYPANKSVWGAKKTIGQGWGNLNIAGN